MTLASLLVDHPAGSNDPLLRSPHETLTKAEACESARAGAESLLAQGVQPHQAVAVQFPDGPEAVAAMFAVWIAGAVFVPVNPRYPAPERDQIVALTRPAVLWTPAGMLTFADAATYDAGVAFVTWTSGTTGAPKPVQHTHANYLELLDRVLAPLRGAPRAAPGRPTPNLVPVSLALNAGIYNVLFGLRAGAEVVVMDRFDTRDFAQLVRRFAIRSTVLPPAAMAMLLDDPEIDDLAPLRFVRSITAPLSPLRARAFADRFGVVVLNSYGQAEIGEVIGWTAADARDHPDKIGAAGRPHPGVAVKLVDAFGGVGRLFVRPPSTAVGLAPDRVDTEGFVDTGDFARVDDEGFVWIEGRASDVINRGGNKVFPEQVEEVLRLAREVADVAVVGARDERLGEVPVAFVVSTGAVDEEALRTLCREHLAPYKVPVAFHAVDALPRNETGKVLRRELLERVAPAAPTSVRGEVV